MNLIIKCTDDNTFNAGDIDEVAESGRLPWNLGGNHEVQWGGLKKKDVICGAEPCC